MSTDRDDDALSWGEDDPTLDTGHAPGAPSAAAPLPKGFTAVGKGSETISSDANAPRAAAAATAPRGSGPDADAGQAADRGTDADTAGPTSNAALIILGIFGGIYALEAIGWVIGGLRLRAYAEFLVSPVAYQVSLWLAVLTPFIWFGTVLFLTRGGRTWVRVLLLAAGALLVLPWPFIMVGAIGS